jgi:transposase
MKIHANARTTVKTRSLLVDALIREGKTKAETARMFATSPRTVAKWVDRYLQEGENGLRDRPNCHPALGGRGSQLARVTHAACFR